MKDILRRLKKYIAVETRQHLRDYKKNVSLLSHGRFKIEYEEKSIILHSKMIFLRISEFYEEFPNDKKLIIHACNQEVLIDSYSYVHILFRHFSPSLKTYQNKTYHTDTWFDYDHLPKVLYGIVRAYFSSIDCGRFDGKSIYFRLNTRLYVMFFEPYLIFEGHAKRTVLRLETCFPITHYKLIQKASAMQEKTINRHLSFLYDS